MSESIPCIRSDLPGASDPGLRALVATAEQLAGVTLAGELVSLYEHDGFLFVTWPNPAARNTWSRFITQALQESRPGSSCQHLVPGDPNLEFDDEALTSDPEA